MSKDTAVAERADHSHGSSRKGQRRFLPGWIILVAMVLGFIWYVTSASNRAQPLETVTLTTYECPQQVPAEGSWQDYLDAGCAPAPIDFVHIYPMMGAGPLNGDRTVAGDTVTLERVPHQDRRVRLDLQTESVYSQVILTEASTDRLVHEELGVLNVEQTHRNGTFYAQGRSEFALLFVRGD